MIPRQVNEHQQGLNIVYKVFTRMFTDTYDYIKSNNDPLSRKINESNVIDLKKLNYFLEKRANVKNPESLFPSHGKGDDLMYYTLFYLMEIIAVSDQGQKEFLKMQLYGSMVRKKSWEEWVEGKTGVIRKYKEEVVDRLKDDEDYRKQKAHLDYEFTD